MNAADRLRAAAGANIRESISRASGATSTPNLSARPADHRAGLNRVKGAFQIPIDRVVPDPNQPRKEFESGSLERLAASLRDRGQLQPIRVRWEETMDRFVIIAGERRWRAAQLAGLATIDAVEASGLSADDVLEEQLVENCLRDDLKPVEQARAFKALMEGKGLSQRQLGERLHVSHAAIAQAVALLALPGDIQEAIDAGQIGSTVGYELSRVTDPAEQARLAAEASAGRLKRDELQERTRTPRKGKARKVTSRILRTPAGRVSIENKRGLTPELMRAALVAALDLVDAELRASTAA